MPLIVGTNSYVSVAEAEAYFAHSIDPSAWNALDENGKEAALITATQYIDERAWIGTAVSSTQKLGWPRTGASYFDEKLGLTVHPSITDIPERVKLAVYEQALHFAQNKNILQAAGQVFESIKVGPISLTDSDKTSNVSKTASQTVTFLKPLTRGRNVAGGGNMWWRAW